MNLRLFDDDPSRAPRAVTLVRLAGEIARALVGVGRIAVEGEVYRPKVSKGGWTFFTLRDRVAQIEVVVPSSNARRCRAVAGERVCVTGALRWTSDRGQAQLVAEEVLPVGGGAIAELIAETRRQLDADGVLGRARRPLPLLPAVVGVVCGADAAVRRDIESVAAVRFPGYPIRFEETSVSGPGASVSIVDALRTLATWPGVEVVILARGGGDAPSLLPWSSEEVCRAVAACPVPVVSAIGHEDDRPLCDEVADVRCGTPSIAAATVMPDARELAGRVDAALASSAASVALLVGAAGRRVAAVDPLRAVASGVERGSVRLSAAGLRMAACHPARQLRSCQQQLAAVDWRRPVGEIVGRAAGRLDAEHRHLQALSPRRTLERGYAVATSQDGSVLRDAGEVRPGDTIGVQLAAGRLVASVTEVHQGDEVGDDAL